MAKNSGGHAPTDAPAAAGSAHPSGMSKSMHDGVEAWCDCCSCEAEPYWVEAFADTKAPEPGAATDQSRE